MGGGGDGGGLSGGGEELDSETTTVTPSVTATSGLASTVTPSVADKLSSGSLAAASAWAMRADASGVADSMSNPRLTLAAVTRSTA